MFAVEATEVVGVAVAEGIGHLFDGESLEEEFAGALRPGFEKHAQGAAPEVPDEDAMQGRFGDLQVVAERGDGLGAGDIVADPLEGDFQPTARGAVTQRGDEPRDGDIELALTAFERGGGEGVGDGEFVAAFPHEVFERTETFGGDFPLPPPLFLRHQRREGRRAGPGPHQHAGKPALRCGPAEGAVAVHDDDVAGGTGDAPVGEDRGGFAFENDEVDVAKGRAEGNGALCVVAQPPAEIAEGKAVSRGRDSPGVAALGNEDLPGKWHASGQIAFLFIEGQGSCLELRPRAGNDMLSKAK